MVTCCVLGCKSRSGRSQNGITFHKFPNNPELKAAWIAAVKRRNWQPTAHSTVCSIHFREEDVDRTSLCCVRIRENRVPCLVSVMQMSCGPKFRRGPRQNSGSGTGSGSDSSSSHGSDPLPGKTTGPQKRSSSVLSENTQKNQETPLDQLAKVATAALEAEPTDYSERKEIKCCTGRKQRPVSNAMSKNLAVRLFGGDTLGRFTSIQKRQFVPVLVPGTGSGPKEITEETVMDDTPENREEMNCGDKMQPETAANRCEVADTCFKGKGTNTSQLSESSSRINPDCVNMDIISQDSEMEPSSANVTCSENEVDVLPPPDVMCVISEVRGASGENVKGSAATNISSDSAEGSGRGSCDAFICTAVPRAHLIDHGTMCRKPQGSEHTLRITKASVSQKQSAQNTGPVYTSAECSENAMQIVYCGAVLPTIQTVIPDHASYCGKQMPVLKTALAVPDHANYSRNMTAMAQATLPVLLPSEPAVEVPVTAMVVQYSPNPPSSQTQAGLPTSQTPVLPESSESSQNPVSAETPSPGPQNQPSVARCLGESCDHEGIADMLKDELKRIGALHTQRRKKVKVLQQALRRSKQKNEKLEKLVAELRKRPKPDDKEELHKKIGKVSVDLWTRQELKAKGEALPIEYSAELGTFAKTLYSHSAEAYEFVRQTFQGCLPHSRTLMKWKSSARSSDQSSTAADSVIITNEKGEQLIVPVLVVNEAPCIEGSGVVQVVNTAADACT